MAKIKENRILKAAREGFQDGIGIRQGELTLYKFIKNSSACRTVPTKHILNTGRGLKTSKKASQSPQNETGQKIKIKREAKDFRMVTWALGRKSWRRKSFHTLGNHPLHPTSRVMGELQNLRGNCSDKFRDRWSEGKPEKIHQRDCCGTVLPSWEAAHVPAVSGGWGQWVGSGFRTQTSERGLG